MCISEGTKMRPTKDFNHKNMVSVYTLEYEYILFLKNII